MDKRNRFAYANIVQLPIDIFFLILTYSLSYMIALNFSSLRSLYDYLWILIIFVPLWIAAMNFRGMYNNTTFFYLDRIFRNVFWATFFAGLLVLSLFFFIKETNTSRLFISIFLTLCLVMMFLERWAFRLISRYWNPSMDKNRIILVCSDETYHVFTHYLQKTNIHYNIIGIIPIGEQSIGEELCLGQLDNLENILKEQVVDQVIFAFPKGYTGEIEKHMNLCLQMGLTVQNVMNYNPGLARVYVSMLGPIPMLTYHTVSLNPLRKVMKRTIDITGALVGIILTLICAVFIVPAIKLDSPGPILFKQKRVGRYGRIFNCYKFRTMCIDAEEKKKKLEALNEYKDGTFFKIKDDPRITKIGDFLRKTSLDELPQFFNVLKGEMSLVGTRPPTLDEVANYDIEHWRRISIKPGITGFWQINGRSSIKDFDQIVALDTQYIDKWSIWLDISILYKTVWLVVKKESAY